MSKYQKLDEEDRELLRRLRKKRVIRAVKEARKLIKTPRGHFTRYSWGQTWNKLADKKEEDTEL